MRTRFAAALAVVAATLAALPAAAVDGVIEINQARALAGGVTGSDAPGFPVTISEPGSYRLTSDLVVPTENLHGIYLAFAGSVTIDLNGFEIRGPVECTGAPPATPVTCVPAEGHGVGVNVAAATDIAVHDGRIRGMGDTGILCDGDCRVERVQVESCGQYGIDKSGGGGVIDSIVRLNCLVGITTNTGLTGSIIRGNTVMRNGDHGMFLGGNDVVTGNVAVENGNDGIFSNGGTVVGNTSRRNGGDGLRVLAGVVKDNTLVLNTGFGLVFGSSSVAGWSGNVIVDNDGGDVSGSGVQLGPNMCDGSLCP